MELTRIGRRRKRFGSAEGNGLRDARRRVAEAAAAGISAEEAAHATGYAVKTVTRWLAKKGEARVVPVERARDNLHKVGERRRQADVSERRIAARARGLVRKAMEVGIEATEFAEVTGYMVNTITKWFSSVRQSMEQAQRQRELASVRRGKRNRPPQHLSPAEYDQWLVQEDRRRRLVLRSHGLGRRLNLGLEGGWLEVPASPSRYKKSLRGKAARGRKRSSR